VTRKDGGGRKEAWDSATREEAVRRAMASGAEAASRATGVPAGTVRSWLRRRAVKAADDDDVEARLAAVKAEGAAIVARRERQMVSPEGARLSAAQERVRLATIRGLRRRMGAGIVWRRRLNSPRRRFRWLN
jgi:hypothetical protein